MKKSKLLVYLLGVSLLITSCNGQPDQKGSEVQGSTKQEQESNHPVMDKKEFPRIDGSTATIPLSSALYQLVTGASNQEAEADVVHTKTTNSYNRLIENEVDLLVVYEPAPEVYDKMKEKNVELDMQPIGRDALVFMANKGNPINSLTQKQLVDIYSGKLNNWSEVGGQSKPIVAFLRPEGSGSQTLMQKLVMKDTKMKEAPSVLRPNSMEEILTDLAKYTNEANAIGYSVYYYAKNMYQQPDLKFMSVDQVQPDNTTIKSGTYPFVNEFYAVIRKDEPKDSKAYILFDFLTSKEGQAFIEQNGYVGVK